MPTITVSAVGASGGQGLTDSAKPRPAQVAYPDFDATVENLHPNAAVDGDYRPIDITLPWPHDDGAEYFEDWLNDQSQQWTATVGSQVGTAVLGETFGDAYTRCHIRGIDVPADGRLTGIRIAKGSAPATPRYATAGEGLELFTGANAIQLHIGTAAAITPSGWVQVEAGPGRHKWDAFGFDTASGVYYRIRCTTWPGLNRVDGTLSLVWHDQRTTQLTTTMPAVSLSVPLLASLRFEFGYEKGMRTESVDATRRYVQVSPARALGDGQGPRATFSLISASAPLAERTDWENSTTWPVRAVADPDHWRYRIGPMRHVLPQRDPCFYDLGSQWGDGGTFFRDVSWDQGFVPYLATGFTDPGSRVWWTQPPLTCGTNSGVSGSRLPYGNSHLAGILGVRNGHPRYLYAQAFSAYWESSIRPIQFAYWTGGAATGRWIRPGDYPAQNVDDSMGLLGQRLQPAAHRPNYESFGKDPAVRFNEFTMSLLQANGFVASHHELTMFGCLALLDGTASQDHWIDFLEINAALYPFNERQFDSVDPSFNKEGQYRTGRSEMAAAWAWEVLPNSSRTWLLDWWEDRFRIPYQQFWGHINAGHEWRTWYSTHATNQLPLLQDYHPAWEFSRGGPGYAAVSRLVQKYKGNGLPYSKVAEEARHHLRYEWRLISGRWEPVYGMQYPGLRRSIQPPTSGSSTSPYIETELYGTAPPEDWYSNPTRVKIDSGTARYWWLGAVQEAKRLVLDVFGDTELADRADDIVRDIVEQFPSRTGNGVEANNARFLMPENHASGDWHPLMGGVRITVGSVGGGAGLGVATLNVGQPPVRITVGSIGGASGHSPLSGAVTVVPVGPDPIFVGDGPGGTAGLADAAAVVGNKVILLVGQIGGTTGQGTVAGRRISVSSVGVGAGLGTLQDFPNAPKELDYFGSWQPEILVRGGWQTVATDQGITIVAGDAEFVRCVVYDDDGQRVDMNGATAATWSLVTPATPYSAEVELLSKTMAAGQISTTTGDVIVQLGDTSSLSAGQAEWSLRVTMSGNTQTVARSACRILDDPIPPPPEEDF